VSESISATPAQFWSQRVRDREWPKWESTGRSLTMVDLFCGCGGLSMGGAFAAQELKRKLTIKLAIDNWQPAMDVYKKNFGNISRSIVLGDVRNVIPTSVSNVDIVVAGPPCQGHSDLNNSTRRVDDRNELYVAAVEFAIACKSRVVLVENVPAVVHSSQQVVTRSVTALNESGYATEEIVLDVSNLGIPQRRKRHLLIASRIHSKSKLAEMVNGIKALQARPKLIDFIGDLKDAPPGVSKLSQITRMSQENIGRIKYLFDNNLYDLPNVLRPPCHRDKVHSYSSMYGRLRPDRPAQTITSGFGSMGQGRFVHPIRARTITPHEAARIQGFPDFFDFGAAETLTDLRDMIANAVPPALAAAVLVQLFQPEKVSKGIRDR